jgi:1-aminocyclopropane-1-carboxylate deaminase/D-cysteine desulfhydrase-like pyridoxal-dependent ACC family enzyme
MELCCQIDENGLTVESLYLATASCGTQAGMLAGIAAQQTPLAVKGISVSDCRPVQERRVLHLAQETMARLGLEGAVMESEVDVDDSYVGDGYGRPTLGTLEAVKLVARTEGILLDPVYSGKAMAALVDHARRGVIPRGSTVMFLHTGGVPALFAYGTASFNNEFEQGF